MAILSTEVYVTISLNKSNLEQYSFFVFLLFLFVCEAELLQAFLGFHKLILIYLGLHIDFSYSVCILFAKSPVQHLPQFPSIIRHLYDLYPWVVMCLTSYHLVSFHWDLFCTNLSYIWYLTLCNVLVSSQDGTANYLKGLMLILCCLIVAASFFVHVDPQSSEYDFHS